MRISTRWLKIAEIGCFYPFNIRLHFYFTIWTNILTAVIIILSPIPQFSPPPLADLNFMLSVCYCKPFKQNYEGGVIQSEFRRCWIPSNDLCFHTIVLISLYLHLDKYHAWVNAEFLLEKCLVGIIDDGQWSRRSTAGVSALS